MQKIIESNIVFKHLSNSSKRITIEQGGTRSGKTYNILTWLIYKYCFENTGKVISIYRKTLPSLRATAMRDFFEILNAGELYNSEYHNRTNNEYTLNGNLIEFDSLDNPTKVRGRKRDVLIGNEINEFAWEDFFQLLIRTKEKVILDLNPSDEFHFIYDKVATRDDAELFITTYKDNPFLEDSLVAEIERLKDIDEWYWKIYGLGERAASPSLVFRYNETKEIPEGAKKLGYGLDWGFSADPTAIVCAWLYDGIIYVKQLLYEKGLTNQDISDKLIELGVERHSYIYADSAEPKSIEELRRLGWHVMAAKKGPDSVRHGITLLRQHKINLHYQSTDLIKEFRNYKYKEDKSGNITNVPIDLFNHAIDALRYLCTSVLGKQGGYIIQ